MIRSQIAQLDGHMLEVVKGSVQSFVVRILGAALGFAVSVLVARLLGVEGAGIYFFALSAAAIGSAFGKLGFDFTSVRFIAASASNNDYGAVRGIYVLISIAVLIGSTIVGVTIIAFASWISKAVLGKPELAVPLIGVGLCVVPMSLLLVQANALRGLKKIPESEWFKTGIVPFVCLLLLVPLTHAWGVNGAIASYVLATVLAFLAIVIYWSRCMRDRPGEYKPAAKGKLFASSWPSLGVTIAGVAIAQAPFVFLGLWGSNEELGLYGAANRLSALLLFPLMAAISILAPKFSMSFHENDISTLRNMAQRSAYLLSAMGIPLVGLVFLGAEWILGFFGEEFTVGVITLRILLLGTFFNMATGAVGELLMMTGNEKSARSAHIAGALIVISGCTVLIPNYGLIGAAWSANLGIIGQNILMIWMVKNKLDFWPFGMGGES